MFVVPILFFIISSCVIDFFILKRFEEIFAGATDNKSMILKALYIVFLHIVSCLMKTGYNMLSLNIATEIEATVLEDLMDLVLRNENNFFNERDPTIYMTNFNRTAKSISSLVYYFLSKLIPLLFSMTTNFYYFISKYKFKGGIPFLITIILYVFIVVKFTNTAAKYNLKKNYYENELNSEISSRIENKKLINEMKTENSEFESFKACNRKKRNENLKFLNIKPITEMVCNFLIYSFNFYILFILIMEKNDLSVKVAALVGICTTMGRLNAQMEKALFTYKETIRNISDIKTGGIMKNILSDENGFFVESQIKPPKIPKTQKPVKVVLLSNIDENTERSEAFHAAINFIDYTNLNKINEESIFELENINKNAKGIFLSVYLNLGNKFNNENRKIEKDSIVLSDCEKDIKIEKIIIKYKDLDEIKISLKDKILVLSEHNDIEASNFILLLKNLLPNNIKFPLDSQNNKFYEIYKNKVGYFENTKFWNKRSILENIQYGNTMKIEKIQQILEYFDEKNILNNLHKNFGKFNLPEKEKKIISLLQFAFKDVEVYLITDVLKGHKKEEILINWLIDFLKEKIVIVGYNVHFHNANIQNIINFK